MNNKEESKKMFALVVYNLLTPTVYTYDTDFLDEVAAFTSKVDLPKKYKALVQKMLERAYAKAKSPTTPAEYSLGLSGTVDKLRALNTTIEDGLDKINNIKTRGGQTK